MNLSELVTTDEGLSPRRRGNLEDGLEYALVLGPIPAQAGEPTSTGSRRSAPRAYPRAGGGTAADVLRALRRLGLSPRRRGNPVNCAARRPIRGPIPAQAGEPTRHARGPPGSRAYPRAGGGTSRRWSLGGSQPGLSPRRRGNRRPVGGRRCATGAYPRAGGGTMLSALKSVHNMGLSPRRRGNHTGRRDRWTYIGPIPAQAGEPPTSGV